MIDYLIIISLLAFFNKSVINSDNIIKFKFKSYTFYNFLCYILLLTLNMNRKLSSNVIQLIALRQDNKQMYLTQQGKQFLQTLTNPISIISIAGLYRTGKSYLINKLLQKCNFNNYQFNKFNVGNTVNSCTKGINVWNIPYQSNNNNKKFSYIILDSQGVGSIEKEINYDINLMMLVFLISSTVIYNSVGPIDQASLDQLRVIVNLKKTLQTNSKNTQPRFLWVLRDFALQLINRKGQIISENEYLQQSLQIINSSNKQVIKKNEIRESIRRCLPLRQCHTLVRPTIKQDQLRNLAQIPQNKIRKQFLDKVDLLHKSIFRNDIQDIKYLHQKQNPVNGQILKQMIVYYLNQINNNRIPQINSVWQLIQSNKFQQIIQQCQHKLKTQVLKIDLPISQDQLKIKLNQIQNAVLTQFQKHFQNDLPLYKKFIKKYNVFSHALNTKIMNANNDIKRKKAMKFVRNSIKKQIQFDKIQPWTMLQIKQIIQKMNLKSIADTEVYEYILTTVLDILQLCQNKSFNMKSQLQQMQKYNQKGQHQHKQTQEELLRFKSSYNQSLKQVNNTKKLLLQKQQKIAQIKQNYENQKLQKQILIKQRRDTQSELRRRIQELNQKLKRKAQESNQSIKLLRTQNQNLINQLQQIKKQLNEKKILQRKQVIFQQKIKLSWDRFQEQRNFLKKELEKYKSLYLENQQKNHNLKLKLEKIENNFKLQFNQFSKKQLEFCQQLKWMKQNYSKTKSAYSQSLNTKMENDKILQDITLGSKNRNYSIYDQNGFVDLKSHVQQRITIQNMNQSIKKLKQQKQVLLTQIKDIKSKNQRKNNQFQQSQKYFHQKIASLQTKIHQLQQQKKQIEQNYQNQKSSFYSALKSIEQSKESQRKIYQESILRLLNNIQQTSLRIPQQQSKSFLRFQQQQSQSFSKSNQSYSKNNQSFLKTNDSFNKNNQYGKTGTSNMSSNHIESSNLHKYLNKSQSNFHKFKKQY